MNSKTALITGANRGIGFEIANQLGALGFHIILSGRNGNKLEEALEQLHENRISATAVVMDISSYESIKSAFDKISADVDSIDVLINNAAILLDEEIALLEISEGDIIQTFKTNSFSALFTVQVFNSLLKHGARVINISSGAGQILIGVTTWAPAYSMSKTLLNALTMHLAAVLKGKDISVNAMCPDWVKTDMGGNKARRSVEKGAETAIWLATECPSTITGKFFRDKREINW
jgi:NAD(P)-dependent dehydrogenase (short-subunit alcohol dehydrogenase family)